jgi:hypothetical protein
MKPPRAFALRPSELLSVEKRPRLNSPESRRRDMARSSRADLPLSRIISSRQKLNSPWLLRGGQVGKHLKAVAIYNEVLYVLVQA